MSPTSPVKVLFSAQEVQARLLEPSHSCLVLDATYYRPDEAIDAGLEFQKAHIPGAHLFDLTLASDPDSSLPHMIPTDDAFINYIQTLGITPRTHIIVYDQQGLFSAARAWWMFKFFGFEAVSVLNGGLPAWNAAGYPLKVGASKPTSLREKTLAAWNTQAVPRIRPHLLAQLFDVQMATIDPETVIVDARAEARFKGTLPEPRPGLRAGHIPSSINLPYTHLIENHALIEDVNELHQRIEAVLGVQCLSQLSEGKMQLISTCGSGVTACILILALHYLEFPLEALTLYDGSWAEWGSYAESDLRVS